MVNRLIQISYSFLTKNALIIVLVIAAASFLAMLLLRIRLVTAYIPEIGGMESNVVYSLQRILEGYPLYTDPAIAPYSITQYTPLYYYLCWLVAKVFQVDPANVHQVYIVSRSVSLVLNLLFASAAFIILKKIFRVGKTLSFIAFAYAFVYLDEESFSRPDSLYNLAFLATIGLFLWLLTNREQRFGREYLVVTSVLSIATIFIKQSGIYLPLLILFFLVFYLKDVRWFLLSLLGMVVSFGVLLLLSSNGNLPVLFQNAVQGVNNGASLTWFAERVMIEHFQKERFINIIGLFVGIYYLAQGRKNTLKFLGLSILGSFTFALVISTKVGAAPNYFTEFITLTVIALAVFITRNNIWEQKHNTTYKSLFVLLLVLFTLPPRFAGKFVKKKIEINNLEKRGYLENQAIARYLYEEEQLLPNDQILVTNHQHDYLNKFLYRNVIFPQKEIVMANPPDAYDYSNFKKGLANGEVNYVVVDLQRQQLDTVGQNIKIRFDFIGADFSSYVPIKQLNHYLLFKHEALIDQ